VNSSPVREGLTTLALSIPTSMEGIWFVNLRLIPVEYPPGLSSEVGSNLASVSFQGHGILRNLYSQRDGLLLWIFREKCPGPRQTGR